MKTKRTCNECNKEFTYRSLALKCRQCWLKTDKKGNNNPNYRGGNRKCMDCESTLNTRTKGVKRCRQCNSKWCVGKNNPHFKGSYMKSGYKIIYINKTRPRVLEHRFIMEQHIGRRLEKHEIIHHINGIRDDNRIENLAITNPQDHEHRTIVKILQDQIRSLEQQLNKQTNLI